MIQEMKVKPSSLRSSKTFVLPNSAFFLADPLSSWQLWPGLWLPPFWATCFSWCSWQHTLSEFVLQYWLIPLALFFWCPVFHLQMLIFQDPCSVSLSLLFPGDHIYFHSFKCHPSGSHLCLCTHMPSAGIRPCISNILSYPLNITSHLMSNSLKTKFFICTFTLHSAQLFPQSNWQSFMSPGI